LEKSLTSGIRKVERELNKTLSTDWNFDMDLKQALLDFQKISAQHLLGSDTPESCEKSRSRVEFDVKGKAVRIYYRKKQPIQDESTQWQTLKKS
jgi:hypothetical protein